MLKLRALTTLVLVIAVCAQNEDEFEKYIRLQQASPTSSHTREENRPQNNFYSLTEAKTSRLFYWLTPQTSTINLNFSLPFFGSRYNRVTVSLNGYLKFTEPEFKIPPFPIILPNTKLPDEKDPSLIAIFLSQLRVTNLNDSGVSYHVVENLKSRTDPPGVELRERIKWDVREGIVGAETFVPNHAIFVTWKNLALNASSSNTTNTFQAVVVTDEVFTYAIFNYLDLQWKADSPPEAFTGESFPYVGFNAGNNSRGYEYWPYSQSGNIKYLTEEGWANGIKGRHIFRLDENVLRGSCLKDTDSASSPIIFAPESGNMLGGTVVNITGPCFDESDVVICRFGEEEVRGAVVDRNRAICVQPRLFAEGYIKFELVVGSGKSKWNGKYFVESPSSAAEKVFLDNSVNEKNPIEIKVWWNHKNLSFSENAPVKISLWGYRESNKIPELTYIDSIEEIPNQGFYKILPDNFSGRNNTNVLDVYFGFIQINLTSPLEMGETGASISPRIWSRPIPLAWYFGPQWKRKYGNGWSKNICDEWIASDRKLANFTQKLPQCPCKLDQALANKGRYLPDPDCDKDSNPRCLLNRGAIHCVRSGPPASGSGSEQQCCYDKNQFLMLSHDQMWGSSPSRSHTFGSAPWNVNGKVPSLSHWYHDITPKYMCCMWQHQGSQGCETLRYERRPSEDCVAYEGVGVAGVFGDPHVITFDNVQYTFNGKAEFLLVKTKDETNNRLDVQGRFEQMPNSNNNKTEVKATQLTSIVARGNTSTTVEVRIRHPAAQWRYRLDIFVDSRRVYFDKPATKFQHFPGVTIYTPTYILNQSEVIVMFDSGAGVEVIENQGFMTARVYLPQTFKSQTRGLLGNWSNDPSTNLVTPEGQIVAVSPNGDNVEQVHREFGIKWMVDDKWVPNIGRSLFLREYGRTSSFYNNKAFLPQFKTKPEEIIPENCWEEVDKAYQYCGSDVHCLYDYSMTYNRNLARFTFNYKHTLLELKEINNRKVASCGVLETPRFGRKSNFLFVPGTRVTFECNEGFVLMGDKRRFCTREGAWDTPDYGYTKCERLNYTKSN